MNGTIYDFSALPRLAMLPPGPVRASAPALGRRAPLRAGVISNPRSHRNRRARGELGGVDGVVAAAPATRAELRDVLAGFARDGVDLLVIDGGDGTVRDALTCSADSWGRDWPMMAVLPSGKTNALAVDLGLPSDWTLAQVLDAARRGSTAPRAPLEITREGDADSAIRGFLFGAGAFVAATALAQATHRAGAFHGVAVGLALGGAVAGTLFGGRDNPWRRGHRMTLDYGAGTRALHGSPADRAADLYLLLASTLERLPLGLKPFGRPRAGLKVLEIDAPPHALAAAVPALLAGSEARRLDDWGYRRLDADRLDVALPGQFILDGELFPAGGYRVTTGPRLDFVVP